MTKGIIQKVISEHNRNECKCKHACHSLLLIQQELIAEINESLRHYADISGEIDHKMQLPEIIKILIGDNKE